MTLLHVGMISFDWYPFEVRSLREAEAAASAGHRVDFICLRQPHEKKQEIYHEVHVYRLPINRSYNGSLPLTIFQWCWFLLLAAIKIARLHMKDRYDIVHVHNMPDFLVFAALFPKLLGARVILDIQDVSPELMGAKIQGKGLLSKIVICLAIWQERISSAFAHHVVTTGEPFTKLLVKRGVPEKKISSILNSADPQLFPVERRCPLPYDSSSTPLESRPFNFMYHGLLAKRNGLDIAIRALAIARRSVPQLRLVIQGIGDQLPFLKELAVTLGISDSVIFTDAPVPPDKIVDFVVRGDAGIVPYRYDGFEEYVLPTKAYEYAWMHRPIIASDTYAIRSMFRPESIYLCHPTRPESFAEAMIDLFQHPEKRATMIASAAEDYLPYRWELMAETYQQLLRSLCRSQEKDEVHQPTDEVHQPTDEVHQPTAISQV